jgi:hypothetical protein
MSRDEHAEIPPRLKLVTQGLVVAEGIRLPSDSWLL